MSRVQRDDQTGTHRFKWVGLASLALWLGMGAAQSAPALDSGPNGREANFDQTMAWIDLRVDTPDARTFRALWADRLDPAERTWKQTSPRGVALPAYSLTQTFGNANPPVVASFLFNLYDCEMPGNGAGADLFARCPLRVAMGRAGSPTKLWTHAGVCMLYVPPLHRPGEGPDPKENYTTVTLRADRSLLVRVVQFGKPVAACDREFRLE